MVHHRRDQTNEANTVVVWVAVLERARRTRDFQLIRKANEELDRLGVFLCIDGQRYGRLPQAAARRRR